MKRSAILALLAASSLAVAASAQPQTQTQPPAPGASGPPRPAGPPRAVLPPPEPIQQITGNVYKIFGGGGNTLVVVQKEGVLLVDTKMPGNGQAILDEVKKVTDKPIVTIISTHSHPDHTGSTDFIRTKYPNVQVIMHENTKTELMAGPFNKPELLPNVTYKDRMTLGKGAERIELYHTGPGHTQGDTFVVVPSARLLFMGDVMAWNMAPFLPAGGASAIADEVDKLVATVKGVDIVVEGHGHVNSWKGLQTFARFNRELIKDAKAAYDRGDPPGAAVAELKKNPEFAPLLDTNIKKGLEYGNTPLARAHMNVNVAYQELAGERVTTSNGAPLPATDKHKGSDPKDTAAPPRPAG